MPQPEVAMEKATSRSSRKLFENLAGLFDNFSGEVARQFASMGSDITIILNSDGTVGDIAYVDGTLEQFGLRNWVGRDWRDTVTVESTEKINTLMDECAKNRTSHLHQVNHPGNRALGLPDLPVEYVVTKIDGFPHCVAFGKDLRKFAEIQQQLIHAQFELERDYRRIRETETRYRLIFQKTESAMVVVSGETRKIIDTNAAAASCFGSQSAKLVDEALIQLFDKQERPAIADALQEALVRGETQLAQASSQHDGTRFNLKIEPFRESGRINLMVTLFPSEHALRFRNGHSDIYQAWMEAVPDALVVTDGKGIVRQVNDRFLDMIHILNRKQVIGRNVNTWVGSSGVDMQVLSSRLRDEGEVHHFLTMVRDDLGATRPVRLAATRNDEDEEPNITILVSEQTQRENQWTVRPSGLQSESSDFAALIGRVPLKDLIREAVDVIEKLCIEAALRQTENNRASAADLLGVSRQSLYMKLRRHDLED
ncbi:MAG: transcriptional regulator PpsR, partial [Nitratireductor sp.]|nr:transcriptional regulator PpsR [Nitratireductor sp.]